MRSYLFLAALFLTSGSLLRAQITITAADYFPSLGDTLYLAFDTIPPAELELQAAGGPRQWDFSGLSADFQQNRPFVAVDAEGAAEFPTAQLMRQQGSNARSYYRTDGDRFELVGFLGVSPIGVDLSVSTAFEPPYVDRWSPVNFIDDHDSSSGFQTAVGADALPQEILDLVPIPFDSLRVKTDIDRRDLVDAYGSLKLPDGLTYAVLREKRTEIRDIKIEAKVNPLPWTDVTPIVLQFLPELAGVALDTAISYTFWSNDAVTPLAKVNVATDGSTVQSVEFRNHPLAASVGEALPPDFRWTLFPNPSSGPVTVDLAGLPLGDYRLELRNAAGQLLQQTSLRGAAGPVRRVFDLGAAAKGAYFLQLREAGGRVLAARRLVLAE